MSEDLLHLAPARRRLSLSRWIGLALLALFALVLLVGPLLVTVDPGRQDLARSLAPIGGDYLLGSDHFGRSSAVRLLFGARLSIGLALLTAASAAIPGTLLGLTAASSGGWIDRALVMLADGVAAIPGLLLVLLLSAFAPGEYPPLYLGFALYLWVEFFRVTRASAAATLIQPHVEAARLLGFGHFHILRRHVLPPLLPLLRTLGAFTVSTVVVGLATLGAIGVGIYPPTPELGSILIDLMPYFAEAPVQLLLPALIIFLFVLALQLAAGQDRR